MSTTPLYQQQPISTRVQQSATSLPDSKEAPDVPSITKTDSKKEPVKFNLTRDAFLFKQDNIEQQLNLTGKNEFNKTIKGNLDFSNLDFKKNPHTVASSRIFTELQMKNEQVKAQNNQ